MRTAMETTEQVQWMEEDGFLPRPELEAAFFYGLFMRGHPLQKLREDIAVSPGVAERWSRLAVQDPGYGRIAGRLLNYRQHVLAIFDSLVFKELDPAPKTQ